MQGGGSLITLLALLMVVSAGNSEALSGLQGIAE